MEGVATGSQAERVAEAPADMTGVEATRADAGDGGRPAGDGGEGGEERTDPRLTALIGGLRGNGRQGVAWLGRLVTDGSRDDIAVQVNTLKVGALKDILAKNQAETGGNKPDLAKRVCELIEARRDDIARAAESGSVQESGALQGAGDGGGLGGGGGGSGAQVETGVPGGGFHATNWPPVTL